jgi:hypothetical protein
MKRLLIYAALVLCFVAELPTTASARWRGTRHDPDRHVGLPWPHPWPRGFASFFYGVYPPVYPAYGYRCWLCW